MHEQVVKDGRFLLSVHSDSKAPAFQRDPGTKAHLQHPTNYRFQQTKHDYLQGRQSNSCLNRKYVAPVQSKPLTHNFGRITDRA